MRSVHSENATRPAEGWPTWRKVGGILLGCLLIPCGSAQTQNEFRNPGLTYLTLTDRKTFLQTGPEAMEFLGGAFEVDLNDGGFVIEGCFANGGESIVPPVPGCELGTTAFLLEGDADGDGSADTQSFWSISNIQEATFIGPGFDRTDPEAVAQSALRVSGAPASSPLRLALIPGVETSVTLNFNVLVPQNVQEFIVTRYGFGLDYNPAQLDQMYDAAPGGFEYFFKVPRLVGFAETPRSQEIRLLKNVFIEAWPGPTPVEGLGAFQVTNEFINGALEFDPRFQVVFNWEGISTGGQGSTAATVVSGDRLYFSLRDEDTDVIVYPLFPEGTPETDRAAIWLEGKLLDGGFSIGPFFQLGVFEPGTEVVAQLEVRRGLRAGGTTEIPAYDYSERIFRWPVRFIDTFEGFGITAFPPGTPSNLREPNFDFDGDGYTNFEEFAYMTDPAGPEDNPNQSLLPEIVDDRIFLTVRKRQFTGDRVRYGAEFSTDGGQTWTDVDSTTEDWVITSDGAQIFEVRSTVSPFDNPGRIRAKVTKLR